MAELSTLTAFDEYSGIWVEPELQSNTKRGTYRITMRGKTAEVPHLQHHVHYSDIYDVLNILPGVPPLPSPKWSESSNDVEVMLRRGNALQTTLASMFVLATGSDEVAGKANQNLRAVLAK